MPIFIVLNASIEQFRQRSIARDGLVFSLFLVVQTAAMGDRQQVEVDSVSNMRTLKSPRGNQAVYGR